MLAKLAYWEFDLNDQHLSFSDIFYEQFATRPSAINNLEHYLELIHPEDRIILQNKLDLLISKKQGIELDHRLNHNNKDYIFHINAQPVFHSKGSLESLRGTIQNITQQRNAEALIEYQRYHDDLTGLPNKIYFKKQLNQHIARSDSNIYLTAIVTINLQRFNEINESLGRQAGEKLLKSFADRLRSLSSPKIIGRYEAETFTLVIDNIMNLDQLEHEMNSIQKILLVPYIIDSHEVFIDTRSGISIYPVEDGDAEILLANSLLALTKAKTDSNNNISFHSLSMNQQARHRHDIELTIRQAMESDRLELFYQPQIDLRTKKLIGAEALIRLKINDDKMMSPLDFIPIAEETGLIIPIGYWIIETACKQIRTWYDMHIYGLRIGINLSAKQFNDQNLYHTLVNAVNKYKLPHESIDLEITESTALTNLDQTIDILQKFKQNGFPISMDDFGTGYSSLSSLHLLPIDILKIDRAFIKDIGPNGEHGTMAMTIINMAHNLNLAVIAEGAETADHISFLQDNNCDEVQGFYYSRPLPAEEFIAFYKNYNANLIKNNAHPTTDIAKPG